VACFRCCFLASVLLVAFFSSRGLPLFSTGGRQNQGVVRIENLAKVSLMVWTCVPCIVCAVLARVSIVACLYLKVCQCALFLQALMEDNEEPATPQPARAFSVGDTVHVYNGTSAGMRAYNTVEHNKWLVCHVFRLHMSCMSCCVVSDMFCHG
jgi:hypothetical protein